MASLRLYGSPLSQPFRSVAWTMLQLGVPFDIQLAVPGTRKEYGTRHENFRALTPYQSTKIPILRYCSKDDSEELSPTVVVESAAIMTHVCERYGGQAMAGNTRGGPVLYPQTGSLEKAMVDSYMHWHHSHTRFLSKMVYLKLMPQLGLKLSSRDDEKFTDILTQLDSGWLHSDTENRPYIGGLPHASIADLMAYSEVSTLKMAKFISLEDYNRLQAWMDHMTQQPFHDEVHGAMHILAEMDDPEEFHKRRKEANATGIEAMMTAQANFAPIPEWEV